MRIPVTHLAWIVPLALGLGYALGMVVEDRYHRAFRAKERAEWEAAVASKRKRDNDRRRQRRVAKAKDNLRG